MWLLTTILLFFIKRREYGKIICQGNARPICSALRQLASGNIYIISSSLTLPFRFVVHLVFTITNRPWSFAFCDSSASEVNVKRLFSGCRDKYDIRRHALKASTVRVLTLLRSTYQFKDEKDTKLIKDAIASDIVDIIRNSVLWRPNRIDSLVAGKLSTFVLI
jgi:hypothetical protein